MNKWSLKSWLDADALLIRLAALVALLSIPLKHTHGRLEGFEHILPVSFVATSTVISFGTSIILLYIAAQVRMRRKAAWYVATILLVMLEAVELLHYRNYLQMALYAAVMLLLLRHRGQYVVTSDTVSMRRGLIIGSGMLVAIVAFTVIVFFVIDQRGFGRDVTTAETARLTARALIHGTIPAQSQAHHYDHALLAMLRLSAVAGLTIAGWSLFRPLRISPFAPLRHKNMAQAMLRQYGASSEDFFKIWPSDKHYFFYQDALVAYGVWGGTAIVIDGAAGNPAHYANIRRSFLDYARLNGWMVAILHCDQQESAAWEQYGLNRLFIGSEAVVDCNEFANTTRHNKHFRYVVNKAEREGLKFELWQPPLTGSQLAALRSVSDDWLRHGGRHEYTFIMGYFDDTYVQSCTVAVLLRDGMIQAYTNVVPQYQRTHASIDHMRFVHDSPSVSMHYLLHHLMLHLQQTGAATCNLGLAPLSKLDTVDDAPLATRILSTVRRLGGRYYSFEGLEQFKNKFKPHWSARYIAFQGPTTKLLYVARSITRLSTYQQQHPHRRVALLAASVVSAGAYASFPLAFWLNPSLAMHGLVSQLGQANQPAALLFNALDVLAAGSAVLVASYLLMAQQKQQADSVPMVALWALVVSSLGAAIAAMVPLPDHYNQQHISLVMLHQPAVLVHGIASFANSAGFVIAAALWGYWSWHSKHSVWRLTLTLTIVLTATFGSAVGIIAPVSAPILQRFFIAAYAVWLVSFTWDTTAR